MTFCKAVSQPVNQTIFQTPSSVAGDVEGVLAARSGFSVDSGGAPMNEGGKPHLEPVPASGGLWGSLSSRVPSSGKDAPGQRMKMEAKVAVDFVHLHF